MDYSSSSSYSQPDPNQYQSQPAAEAAPSYDYDPHSNYHYQHQQPYYPYDPHYHQQYYNHTLIRPPGVSIPDPTHLNNASSSYSAPLSDPTQFPGYADLTLQQQIGQIPYRGGRRRGNRPFQGGGGQGHLSYHASSSSFTQDGSGAPTSRGRGRGQSGSRHFQLYGAVSCNPNSASVPAEGAAASSSSSMQSPPSALVIGQEPLPVPTQVSTAPLWRPPRMAWCELCRVDCNTPQILEQHKNGKRHKKNLLVNEELQKRNKVHTEQQNAQSVANTELKPGVGHTVEVESKLTSRVVTDDNRNGTDVKDMVGNTEASAEPGNKSGDHFAARGRGVKRRVRGGRGGKYMRTSEGSRRPVQPPKPKQATPFICELCNVKCESQVVFDSHLIGKKHLATLKKFEDHRALYGENGLQALYPPNLTSASTSAAPHLQQGVVDPQVSLAQVQQGVNDPQVLLAQLLMSVLSQSQAQCSAPPPGSTSGVAPTPGTSLGIQNHQLIAQIQGLLAMCQNAIMVDANSQSQSGNVKYEAPAAWNTEINTGNRASEIVLKEEASVSKNDTVVAPAEKGGPSGKECVVDSASTQPEPEDRMQEPESKIIKPTE